MSDDQSRNPPDDQWTREVCRIGQGEACCRYLTMAPGGWSCEKHTVLSFTLDARAAAGTINARGDNCPGRGAR